MKADYPSVAKACTSGWFQAAVWGPEQEKPNAVKDAGKTVVCAAFAGSSGEVNRTFMVFPGSVRSTSPFTPDLAPEVLQVLRKLTKERVCVNPKAPSVERRRWPRLPLAIPVFVRTRLEQEKEFLEFATALNVSAGGMLVAVPRSLPAMAEVSLEIPSAPLAALAALPRASRTLRAKVLRTEHAEAYNLVGLKFSRPLVNARVKATASRRKQRSFV